MFNSEAPLFIPLCGNCCCNYHGISKQSFYRRKGDVDNSVVNFERKKKQLSMTGEEKKK